MVEQLAVTGAQHTVELELVAGPFAGGHRAQEAEDGDGEVDARDGRCWTRSRVVFASGTEQHKSKADFIFLAFPKNGTLQQCSAARSVRAQASRARTTRSALRSTLTSTYSVALIRERYDWLVMKSGAEGKDAPASDP